MEISRINKTETGKEIFKLIETLFPITRSITGNGVRETLNIIKKIIPIEIGEIPSGTEVYDWSIPREWNITDAYIKNSKGEKIVDFKNSNIHVLNYSIPVHKRIPLFELKDHIHTLPDYPDWIPYLTSYYKEMWGFCMSHNQYRELNEDTYEVFIDSSLKDGSLTYGELFIKGEIDDEVLLSTYICHPSLCNDNLTGPGVLTFLARHLLKEKLRYSYRLIFVPETIGSIAWLWLNEEKVRNIKHGLVLTCLGSSEKPTYKKSKNGNEIIDKVVLKVLEDSNEEFDAIDFFPPKSDERQYSTPGFNLPVGLLTKGMIGKFKEYHTSADNLAFINSDSLGDSWEKYLTILYTIDNNRRYITLNTKCEPKLLKRNLQTTIGGMKEPAEYSDIWAIRSFVYFADGNNSLLDIAIRTGISFKKIKESADILIECGLIKEC